MCPQYARNNFCQPCPALENTTTSSNREKQDNHVVSLSHREIAISSPFRDPQNDPEASISTESALMCTHCTRNMLGTTFVSDTQPWKTTQHRQDREKQENHVVSMSHRFFLVLRLSTLSTGSSYSPEGILGPQKTSKTTWSYSIVLCMKTVLQ